MYWQQQKYRNGRCEQQMLATVIGVVGRQIHKKYIPAHLVKDLEQLRSAPSPMLTQEFRHACIYDIIEACLSN